jgi:hypothetical protein
MDCKISYVDPVTRQSLSAVVEKSICIGRSPGKNGLIVGGSDEYVSSIALEISKDKTDLVIWNRSSHSELDIRLHTGVRILFPDEKIVVREPATIIIPSAVYMYKIEVDVSGVEPIFKPSTGTQRLDGHDLVLAVERIPTLCGLCASYFYAEKYGSAPLTANQIAEKLKTVDSELTPKAVNNKIQRTREQVEAATGAYLNDREGLALFLIRKGHITKEMVDKYF